MVFSKKIIEIIGAKFLLPGSKNQTLKRIPAKKEVTKKAKILFGKILYKQKQIKIEIK